jgi:hypothetical protein
MLNESLHPIFYTKTFYELAKKYPLDLADVIIDFFRKKKVVLVSNTYMNSVKVDSKKLHTLEKEKKDSFFHQLRGQVAGGQDFFNASSTSAYREFKMPAMEIGEYTISSHLQTNDSFFENGHDLIVIVAKDGGAKSFRDKVLVLEKVEKVLETIYSKILEKIDLFEEEENKTAEPAVVKKTPVNDIVSIYSYTLRRFAVDKKGGREIKDLDDGASPPIEFRLKYRNDGNSSSSLFKSEVSSKNFSLEFTIKAKKPDSDSTLKDYPQIKTEFDKYCIIKKAINVGQTDDGKEDMSYQARKYQNYQIKDYSPEKLYTQEQQDFIDINLRQFCYRVGKLGYFISNTEFGYGRSSQDEIKFSQMKDGVSKFSDEKIKKISDRRLKELFIDKIQRKYFNVENIKSYYNKKLAEEILSFIQHSKSNMQFFNDYLKEKNASVDPETIQQAIIQVFDRARKF